MLYMHFLISFFILHAFFISLNIDFFISYFIYIISSFIMKNTYAALLEFSAYINSDFKYNICKHCVYNVINLNNNCKHTVN